ncbi:MAG: hypothetical protein AB1Z23_06570 [Eubacteriales bacterium]
MNNKSKWYRLDTSAKIYPAMESARNPSIFRMSVTLKKAVNPNILLQAAENIKVRFPYYAVKMKKGLFWSYLEQNTSEHIIWKDTQSPCSRIHPMFNNGFLFKIKYFNKRISVDFFHVLTDGYGASQYLKSLVAEYLKLTGDIDEIDGNKVMEKSQQPDEEEHQDAFLNVLEKQKDMLPEEKKRSLFGKNVFFKEKGKSLPVGKYSVVTAIADIKQLKEISKGHDATITQLIASLYAEALIHLQKVQVKDIKKHKNVSVQIPVNMRRFYPTKCMRNFALFIIPPINPREIKSLDDIIQQTKLFMSDHLTTDHLLTMIEDNCSIATNFFVRHVPLFIKNSIVRFISNTSGTTQFSGTLSNIGVLDLPENMKEHIDYADFVLGPTTHNKSSGAMISFGNKAAITFGRSIKSAFIAEHVFTRLVELGVEVTIKSNY